MLCSAVLGKLLGLFSKVMISTFSFSLRKLQLLCEGVNFELRNHELHDKSSSNDVLALVDVSTDRSSRTWASKV